MLTIPQTLTQKLFITSQKVERIKYHNNKVAYANEKLFEFQVGEENLVKYYLMAKACPFIDVLGGTDHL